MRVTNIILSGAALIALAVRAAFAQQATPNADPATIQQRKDNQQDRIANGVQDGQLTAGETKNLETKEAGLNAEEHTMRADDSGKLTAADRTTLQNQQNHLSNQIHTDATNSATQHEGTGEIG